MPVGHKSPGSLAAEIKMTRMIHSGAFLVVEGVSDKRFWTPRCQDTCEIVDGEGKENILGGIQLLDLAKFSGALGIVDDDGDVLLGVTRNSKNIVATDARDCECLLLRSSALDTVLVEYGEQEKIRHFEETEGHSVRDGLLNRALVFGVLRIVARQEDIKLNGAAFSVRRFMSEVTWSVSCSEVMEAARGGLSVGEVSLLTQRVEQLHDKDPWQMVRGHDMVEILRVGLKNKLGSLNNSIGVQEIKRMLRAAFSPSELESTALWQQIRKWEADNNNYPILRKVDHS